MAVKKTAKKTAAKAAKPTTNAAAKPAKPAAKKAAPAKKAAAVKKAAKPVAKKAAAKAATLKEWAEASGVPLSATVAIGDGANDLEMMAIAGLSVAYNAKPIVRDRASVSIESDLSLVIDLLDGLG